MDIDRYELILALAGVAALLAAWLPTYVRARPLSLPLALVALGYVVFTLPLGLPRPDPRAHLELTERITEFGVIVALTGAGLKLDRPLGWRAWGSTWRMLAVAMPITIALVAIGGLTFLSLGLPAAVLLGACMAPTDPVLASEVQVGEPTVEGNDDDPQDEDEVRFTLTAEGGLNDALAFPFVYLAIRMAEDGTSPSAWLGGWLSVDLALRLAVAVVVGVAVGRLLAIVLFRPPGPLQALADTSQGFVAIAMTLLAYGCTELVHGYGFLAVFVAAVTVRAAERRSSYHKVLHEFSDQAENLLVVGLLVALGGAAPVLLEGLGWRDVALALFVLFVARPVAGMLSLWGSRVTTSERRAIAFFGVRGIGSLYYLAYAVSAHEFEGPDGLWRVATLTILLSVVIHGVLATPTMNALDRARDRRARRRAERGATAVSVLET